MVMNFDSIANFTVEHIKTWIINFSKVNKQNFDSISQVQEEIKQIEKKIFTKNMKMEIIGSPNRDYIKTMVKALFQ